MSSDTHEQQLRAQIRAATEAIASYAREARMRQRELQKAVDAAQAELDAYVTTYKFYVNGELHTSTGDDEMDALYAMVQLSRVRDLINGTFDHVVAASGTAYKVSSSLSIESLGEAVE